MPHSPNPLMPEGKKSKTLVEKYKSKTPIKWRKIGDALLIGTSGLSAIMMGAPIPDKYTVWVIFTLNVIGVIGKVITSFFTEEEK